jgi:uncharacterized membrane protein
MPEVHESIAVGVPVSVAYEQWRRYEDFPQFMENVESVKRIDDKHVHWVAELAGRRHEWDAEVTYDEPDEQITWRAIDGKQNNGSVKFKRAGEDRTEVDVQISWEADNPIETVGGAVGVDDRGVKTDLKRFKDLVEGRVAAGS